MSIQNPNSAKPSTDSADQELKLAPITVDGQFISMTGNHLVMTNTAGKRCSHTLARDAKLMRDGIACKAEDLKAGSKVRVTMQPEDESMATGIEALGTNTEFTQCH